MGKSISGHEFLPHDDPERTEILQRIASTIKERPEIIISKKLDKVIDLLEILAAQYTRKGE